MCIRWAAGLVAVLGIMRGGWRWWLDCRQGWGWECGEWGLRQRGGWEGGGLGGEGCSGWAGMVERVSGVLQ